MGIQSVSAWAYRACGRPIAALAVLAACASVPHFQFVPDDGGTEPPPGTTDAGVNDATSGTVDSGQDAGDPDTGDDSSIQDPGDDGGPDPDGGLECDGSAVASCAECQGATLRCKRIGVDECVSDCAACGQDWLPCFHCPSSNPPVIPRGNCLPVGKNGKVSCAETNLCPCSSADDCPASPGAAQTCILDPKVQALRCLTCGAPLTQSRACARDDGGAGKCVITPNSPPVCQ